MSAKKSKKPAPAGPVGEEGRLPVYRLPVGFVYEPPTLVPTEVGPPHWSGGTLGDDPIEMFEDLP